MAGSIIKKCTNIPPSVQLLWFLVPTNESSHVFSLSCQIDHFEW
jgi:hypothetical protein